MTPRQDGGALLLRRHGQSVSDADGVLFPLLHAGATPLVVGHGNSLRAFVMYLEKLGPAEVERLDIPTAVPMRCRLGRRGNPVAEPGGRYLDPVGAAEPVRVGARWWS